MTCHHDISIQTNPSPSPPLFDPTSQPRPPPLYAKELVKRLRMEEIMPLRLSRREPSAALRPPFFLDPPEEFEEDEEAGLPDAIAARRRDCRRPEGGGSATGFLAAVVATALLLCLWG